MNGAVVQLLMFGNKLLLLLIDILINYELLNEVKNCVYKPLVFIIGLKNFTKVEWIIDNSVASTHFIR